MFKMFGHDPIVLGMETMFQPKCRYLGNKITFIDLEQLHSFHMRVAVGLHEARKKSDKQYSGKNTLPKIGDAVLFRNHSKTGFSPNFLPGYCVVKIINDANYVIKHMTTGRSSQVHIRDLIVSPMIRQVLDHLPPAESFGHYGKFANCPKMALRD